MKQISRRMAIGHGLAGIFAAGAAPMFAPARLFGADAPSKKITIGCIGIGTHGFAVNLKSFLNEDAARVLVCCDVFRDRAAKGKAEVDQKYGNADCATTQDYREVLARKDVDAVMISTPDHWHVPMSLKALTAGKDVICEKPTLTIAEGRTLVDAVMKHDRVFQVSLEDRALMHYHRLAELVRNGAIGKLKHIEVKLPAGRAVPKEAEEKPPETLDWNMWLGPAPLAPWSKSRTEPDVWRQIREYSGGKFTDWGAHLLDTAQVANFAEDSGPVEVEGRGDRPVDSMSSTFINYDLSYRYANGVTMNVKSGGVAIRFEGEKGWIGNNGWQGGLEASDKELLMPKYDAATNKIWPRPHREHRNFLDCVKSRAPTMYTAEAGQRLSTVMHIGNIAMELGRKLKWDPATESFPGDEAANALRSRASRAV